ncbi:hypothetical protein N0B44_26885 [Roseibacterium beibuensis]|uniref:Flagellar motility protein MotE, a chaperone for MotC folding n=1 Tax=[Roseibacterium] beibuensis TaxID=1193142 RepID=A0ABP9LEX0_9RHOB|nr:hypothetical protein [Roseibacterium beibuensis]MCS6626553.1 hypothetical protein [Roseibacterium beibuensis]
MARRTVRKSKTPHPRRMRRGWLLFALGLSFAASGVLRLGALDWAQASEPAGHATAAPFLPETGRLRSALDEVAALRAQLVAREADLEEREAALMAAQTLIEDRLVALEQAEARLARLVSVSDTAAETDIDQLTRVYETMAPEEAARLFERMEPSFAAGFLSRMALATSAALLAELDPDVAYAISVVLATRNATAPVRSDPEISPPDTEN